MNLHQKEPLLCPYRTKTVTFHNTRDNRQLPPIGWNGIVDHDVQSVFFLPCIKEQCALYDPLWEMCKLKETQL